MKKVTVGLSLLITLHFFVQAKAEIWDGEFVHTKEGFSKANTSENFKNAWFSTVPIFAKMKVSADSTELSSGSGVIVFKKIIGNFTYVGVLTAEHVINTYGPKTLLLVMRDTIFDAQSGEEKLNAMFEGFHIVSRTVSNNADIGFILLRGPNKNALNISMASFPRKCDLKKGEAIALIGYPRTDIRPRENQNVPISEPTVMRRRISTGFYEGSTQVLAAAPGVSYGTTADSLGGSSGGPAINYKGEVVGILSGSFNSYTGKENGRDLKPHSFIVDCQTTKDFAEKNWQNFLNNPPVEI